MSPNPCRDLDGSLLPYSFRIKPRLSTQTVSPFLTESSRFAQAEAIDIHSVSAPFAAIKTFVSTTIGFLAGMLLFLLGSASSCGVQTDSSVFHLIPEEVFGPVRDV